VKGIRRGKIRQLGETLHVLHVGDWFVWAFAKPGGGWRVTVPFPAFSRERMALTDDELDAQSWVLVEAMESWEEVLGMVQTERRARQTRRPALGTESCTQEVA